MIDLTVIVVSYNTKKLTIDCLNALLLHLKKQTIIQWEVIVIDNNSIDGTQNELKKMMQLHKQLAVIYNAENKGYSKANNQGLRIAKGRYILYLNSDVLVSEKPFLHLEIGYLDNHPKVGALTVKVILKDKTLDLACHRGFPTLWRSFCYFCGLERLTANISYINKIFGGYHLTALINRKEIHEIDSPTGAFFLARKGIVHTLRGFDEQFFMYGEDIDLAFRMKRLGYQIMFDPAFSVTHYKYQSGLQTEDKTQQKKTYRHFWESVLIFYKKHYIHKYPQLIYRAINYIVEHKLKLQ